MALAHPDQPAASHVAAALPTFSVIDVETSGLSTRRHRVLQIALVRVDGAAIVDEWTSLVRLRWPWQRVGPRRVHGISRATLRGAPAADAVLSEFADRVAGTVVVAHNIRFDWPFVDRAASRARVSIDAPHRICTLQMSRRLDPDRELSHRLADLCERYDVSNERPHDALYDARATALVLPHLLRAHEIATEASLAEFYEADAR